MACALAGQLDLTSAATAPRAAPRSRRPSRRDTPAPALAARGTSSAGLPSRSRADAPRGPRTVEREEQVAGLFLRGAARTSATARSPGSKSSLRRARRVENSFCASRRSGRRRGPVDSARPSASRRSSSHTKARGAIGRPEDLPACRSAARSPRVSKSVVRTRRRPPGRSAREDLGPVRASGANRRQGLLPRALIPDVGDGRRSSLHREKLLRRERLRSAGGAVGGRLRKLPGSAGRTAAGPPRLGGERPASKPPAPWTASRSFAPARSCRPASPFRTPCAHFLGGSALSLQVTAADFAQPETRTSWMPPRRRPERGPPLLGTGPPSGRALPERSLARPKLSSSCRTASGGSFSARSRERLGGFDFRRRKCVWAGRRDSFRRDERERKLRAPDLQAHDVERRLHFDEASRAASRHDVESPPR